MPKLQVLITTMYNKNLDGYKKMNLQTDAFFANQGDEYFYLNENIDGHNVQMLSTVTRGLSRNRNIAMTCSDCDADYIMFCDDDLTFYDGYEQMIMDEFKNHPEADAIKFNMNDVSESDGKRTKVKQITKFHKATKFNSGAHGACALVLNKKLIEKYNLHFNESFGAGTENYCGEDSIFIKDMIKMGINLYFSPTTICEICTVSSTWFEGHNEKYFKINGKVMRVNFPVLSKILPFIQAYRLKKRGCTSLSYKKIVKCYFEGMKDYKSKK